jgi:DNA polymerase-3 subunit beta
MRFSIQREVLLKPLQQVVGVVERRHTLPVLANVLVQVNGDTVSFTGTDLEVEMVATARAEDTENGETTLPARKFFDLVRALPDGAQIALKLAGDKTTLQAGRSRFTLATLPASEFPTTEEIELVERASLPEAALKELMDRTSFAMANQDVRYYLNGLLLDLRDRSLRCVATDGHRLAMAEAPLSKAVASARQIIIPRKGVAELAGLFETGEGDVELEFGRNHIRLRKTDVVFTSKLIDGRFPDYEAVVPIGADQVARVPRDPLRACLSRAAILSNEKYRGVRLEFSPGKLRIVAHNPEQEEAVEELEIDTSIKDLVIGFNVGYLLDALGALDSEQVRLCLRDPQSSLLIQDGEHERIRHVVMPLRL